MGDKWFVLVEEGGENMERIRRGGGWAVRGRECLFYHMSSTYQVHYARKTLLNQTLMELTGKSLFCFKILLFGNRLKIVYFLVGK